MMERLILVGLIVLLGACSGSGSDPDLPPQVPPTATNSAVVPQETLQPPVRLAPVGAPGAARRLRAEPQCRGSETDMLFSWMPSGAGRQRVDITYYPGGLEARRYEASQSLAPKVGEFLWPGVVSLAVYEWRVLTRADGEWVPSATGAFDVPECGVGDPDG